MAEHTHEQWPPVGQETLDSAAEEEQLIRNSHGAETVREREEFATGLRPTASKVLRQTREAMRDNES